MNVLEYQDRSDMPPGWCALMARNIVLFIPGQGVVEVTREQMEDRIKAYWRDHGAAGKRVEA